MFCGRLNLALDKYNSTVWKQMASFNSFYNNKKTNSHKPFIQDGIGEVVKWFFKLLYRSSEQAFIKDSSKKRNTHCLKLSPSLHFFAITYSAKFQIIKFENRYCLIAQMCQFSWKVHIDKNLKKLSNTVSHHWK